MCYKNTPAPHTTLPGTTWLGYCGTPPSYLFLGQSNIKDLTLLGHVSKLVQEQCKGKVRWWAKAVASTKRAVWWSHGVTNKKSVFYIHEMSLDEAPKVTCWEFCEHPSPCVTSSLNYCYLPLVGPPTTTIPKSTTTTSSASIVQNQQLR